MTGTNETPPPDLALVADQDLLDELERRALDHMLKRRLSARRGVIDGNEGDAQDVVASQRQVAKHAAARLGCDADDPTLWAWVRLVTVAAVEADWLPRYPPRLAVVDHDETTILTSELARDIGLFDSPQPAGEEPRP